MSSITKSERNGLTRRRLLTGLVASALAPGLLRHGEVAAQGKSLIFLTWGSAFGKGVRIAFSDPFTKATSIPVVDVTPFNYGRFVTAMQNGNPEGFDLVWFSDEVEPARAGEMGLLEKLDYSLLPAASRALPSARAPFGVSPYVTTYQVGYRTDAWPVAPSSWKDFWDVTKFPGPRSLGTSVLGVLEAALMADGVEPSKLYPLDEERAFRKLNAIKPHIRVFNNTSAPQQARQMLFQNEISMMLTWSGEIIAQHKAGKPVNVIWNQGFYFSPQVGIAKGSPLAKQAHRYLNQFFETEPLLAFARAFPTTPAVPEVGAMLTPDERALTASGHLEQMVNLNRDYYFANLARLQQRYDSWRAL